MVKYLKKALIFLLLTAYCLPIYGATYYLVRRGVAAFYSYEIDQSARFNDDDSAYTLRAVLNTADDGNKNKTFSLWAKRGNLGIATQMYECHIDANNQWGILFDASDHIQIYGEVGNVVHLNKITTAVYRDPTSWYHVFVVIDTTEATAADRVKLYVNGTQVTAFGTDTIPAQNFDIWYQGNGSGTNNNIVGAYAGPLNLFDGYLAEFYALDNNSEAVTTFGEFKNIIWIPKDPGTLTYGTLGFYLDFSNSSDFGEDQSGNNNDFTDSGLATNDQGLDTPTDNYPTLNPIHHLSTATLANGNLECSGAENEYGTRALSSGKWSWEVTVNENGDFGMEATDGTEEVATDVSGEVVEMLLDLDNGTLKKKVDGGSIEDIELSVDLTKDWYPHFKAACAVDFGQLGHTSSVAGYNTLASSNMDDPTIKDSSEGFYVKTRTGTGAEATISDVNFDVSAGALVWIKERNVIRSHRLVDTVRGATYEIYSNTDVVEGTQAQGVKSFTSTGYVLGTSSGTNENTKLFIDWVFREGSSYGVDVVKFTGTGVAHAESHSLGVAPEMMFLKNLDTVRAWGCYHSLVASDPETDYASLHLTNAFADSDIFWNDTAPTTTEFTVGTGNQVNENGDEIIAYLFTSVEGFSKAFSYTGNGSADGPYIDLGFRPAWFILKEVPATSNWSIFDHKRLGYNVDNDYQRANSDAVDQTSDILDLTASGFKIRSTAGDFNTSGNLYVGFAFAEQPGKYSNAR